MAILVWALALQEESGGGGGGAIAAIFGIGFTLVMLAFVVLMIASGWKIFSKAGEPGWASIVPIYNVIVVLKIGGKPVWWILLFLIPLVNFIIGILLAIAIAEKFGKGTGFGLGMAFLPFIFYPMLAFGDAQYRG
jgi:hypothetical protein